MAAYDADADADALAQRLATDGYALVADWLSADDAAHVRLEANALAFEPSRVISGGRKVVDAERTDEICWLRGASGHPPALAGVAARLRALGRGLGVGRGGERSRLRVADRLPPPAVAAPRGRHHLAQLEDGSLNFYSICIRFQVILGNIVFLECSLCLNAFRATSFRPR